MTGKGIYTKDEEAKRSGGKSSNTPSTTSGNKTKGRSTTPQGQVTPPTSVFGSWTGKIPTVLLYEQTVRNGWCKPDYYCARKGGITYCKITLSKMKQSERLTKFWSPEWPGEGDTSPAPGDDDVTGAMDQLQVGKSTSKPKRTTQPTPSTSSFSLAPKSDQEAKQFAATFVLHRICSHIRLDRMLPPAARDYWDYLEAEKRAILDPMKRELLYAADPWEAQLTFDRLVRDQQNTHQPKSSRSDSRIDGSVGASGDTKINTTPPTPRVHRYPKLDCPNELLLQMENLIKSADKWARSRQTQASREAMNLDTSPTANQRAVLIEKWTRNGFKEAHVREALQHCESSNGLLDWLILHVPHEELPLKFRGKGAFITSSHAADRSVISLNPKVRRWISMGFPVALVEDAMLTFASDESRVVYHLTRSHLLSASSSSVDSVPGEKSLEMMTPYSEQELEEEIESLESMYSDVLEHTNQQDPELARPSRIIKLALTLDENTVVALEIFIPSNHDYPYSIPGILLSSDSVATYLLMRGMKMLASHAEQMRGQLMMYSLIDWVETEFAELLRNPPSLLEVSDDALVRINPVPVASEAWHKSKDETTSNRRYRNRIAPNAEQSLRSKAIAEQYEVKLKTTALQAFMRKRQLLPSFAYRQNILDGVSKSQVILICGETGCGKSTQTGQFILEHAVQSLRGATTRIICTQPRRLSATALAQRVAEERCETLGESVGYVIKGESVGPNSPLVFVTTGVLLRMLISDPELAHITHIIMDEVHERARIHTHPVDSDFLLIIIRALLKRRPELKLILMSATIDSHLFSSYFDGAPVLNIPGFIHPVQEHYLEDIISLTGYDRHVNLMKDSELESKYPGLDKNTASVFKAVEERIDYDLIAHLVRYIDHTYADDLGSVLIFLPGAGEIDRCIRGLEALSSGAGTLVNKLELLPLHANLPNKIQSKVFKSYGKSCRKVVVATNVAETSITISDVVYVIDAGKVKEMRHEKALSSLVETWASKASCRQRKGRAGRVKPGHVFRLFSRLLESRDMSASSLPEMVRMPLEQVCLQVRALDYTIAPFLEQAISPPPAETIEKSVLNLIDLGALERSTESLTALGRYLSQLPMDVRIGKLLLYGALFNVLDPILTIASAMSNKSPFLRPDRNDKLLGDGATESTLSPAEMFARETGSDWLAILGAFEAWHDLAPKSSRSYQYNNAQAQFCQEHRLAQSVMVGIADGRRQYFEILSSMGFQGMELTTDAQASPNLIKAILCSGLYPNIARIEVPDIGFDKTMYGSIAKTATAKDLRYYTREDGRVFHHPSSVNFQLSRVCYYCPIVVYLNKQKTSKIYLMDSTTTSSWAVLFFGGPLSLNHHDGTIAVGTQLKISTAPRTGVLISGVRNLLEQALANRIEKSASPQLPVIQLVRDILSN